MLSVKYCYEHNYQFALNFDKKYVEVFEPLFEDEGIYVYSHRYSPTTVKRFCRLNGLQYVELVTHYN